MNISPTLPTVKTNKMLTYDKPRINYKRRDDHKEMAVCMDVYKKNWDTKELSALDSDGGCEQRLSPVYLL